MQRAIRTALQGPDDGKLPARPVFLHQGRGQIGIAREAQLFRAGLIFGRQRGAEVDGEDGEAVLAGPCSG